MCIRDRYVGNKHSIAVSNGSVALEIALKSLNLKTGDQVIVTPRSFIISASCVINQGLRPVFADIDKNGNLDINGISNAFNIRVKAIILVHLNGLPCDITPIIKFVKKKKLFLIEDCSQAHGAKYKGKSVGSFGDVSTWSFCQDKIISTGGEGGMISTNNKKIWQFCWSFKDHGKNYFKATNKNKTKNFKWLHEYYGSNYRMTEMQAAIGRIQLKRMDNWHNKRNENAQTILKTCQEFSNLLRVPIIDNYLEHGWYKLYVYVRQEKLSKAWNRNRIIKEISKFGIKCYAGSCSEIYLEKAFDNKYRPNKRLPNAKELGETSIMFLVHPTLTFSDINLSLIHI